MRILKTRYQRIDGVEFSVLGGLLAHGYKGAAFWPNPVGEREPIKVSVPHTQGAAFVGPRAQIGYCDSTGVQLFRASDMSRHLVLDVKGNLYSVTAVGESQFILHSSYRPLLLAYNVRHHAEPQLLWSVPQQDSSRPVCVSDREFLQFETRRVLFRNTETGNEIRRHSVDMFVSSFTTASLSSDGHWLAHTITLDNEFAVADVTTHDFRTVQRIKNTDGRHFTSLAFHPFGRCLAATSNDATVKLYDTSNWSLARTYTWDIGRMRSVAFSPDGLLAAAGSDTGRVVVWDVDV